MTQLPVRVLSRTGGDARREESVSPTSTAPLLERPVRSRVDAPPLTSPASAVRIQFPQAGARFALHALILRGEDGADLYRWAGSGDLFRGARDLRAERSPTGVLVECLSDETEVEILLDPRLSSRAVSALLTVSEAGRIAPAAADPAGPSESIAAVRRELSEMGERMRTIQEDVAASQAQITAHHRWLERQFEMQRRRSDMLVEMTELQYRALVVHEDAQRKLEEIYGSASWRLTRPLRGAAKVARGEAPLGYAWRRLVLALLQRTPISAQAKARVRSRFAPGSAPPVAAPEPEFIGEGQAGPLEFPLPGRITVLPEVEGAAPEPLALTVSVVIPTLNAGDEFYWLLRKLRAQKGLKAVEIVVVDSGSSDGTDALAQEMGCTLVRIPSADFSHSHARNVGADAAGGDLLLFMVQDAYPVGDWWLHTLAKALVQPRREAERLAAVSCAEVPRSDSELLYNAMIDTHYRFLGCHEKDRVGAFAGSDHESLRRQGQVSDVACMMTRDIFQAYRYQGRYAEDLILGVRLIKDGRRTGMLSSVKVVHSHNRPTGYYLRRVFVDVVFLTEVFPDFAAPAASSAAAGLLAAERLKDLVDPWRPKAGAPAAEALRDLAARARGVKVAGRLRTDPPDFGYAPIRPWFQAAAEAAPPAQAEAEQVRESFAARLDHLAAYVEGVYPEVDEFLAGELAAAAQKTLAMMLGAHLAYVYLNQRPGAEGEAAARLDRLRDILLAGI
ncbi:MAG: glycosyltransferase family 2 protein [Phenylobacterium sp.]